MLPDPQRRAPTPGPAAVGAVGAARLADLAETDRVVLELAVSAARVGVFDLDVASGVVAWDDRLGDILGLPRAAFDHALASIRTLVHPEDAERVSAALATAIQTCGTYEAEYRIVRPDGRTGWIVARGRALCDEAGVTVRVLGAVLDTTALRQGEARTARVLESMAVGYLAVDAQWRITYLNTEGERIVTASRDELVGQDFWTAFPATVGSEFERHYRRAVATGETVTFDAHYPPPLDVWVEVRAVPEDGGLTLYFLDITERRTAQQASERAATRSALLARVASTLAESLDATTALGHLPQMLVPALADWCILTLAEDGPGGWRGRLRDVGSWHADPARRELTERYREARIPALTESSYVARAFDTSEPVVVRSGGVEAALAVLEGPARALCAELAPESFALLPLRGRGRTLGVLTVYNGAERGALRDADIATLREVAGQVGLALDNARLHAAQRDLATELQTSLLTALPEPDHLQITARYAPAAHENHIGGDWYDAFLTRDGATCLVIGDVAGHDSGAAVAMAQVRNLLRGVAYTLGEPPASVLSMLDAAMHDLAAGTLTTAVLAVVEQTTDDAERGLRTLRWSNAGHPPPLLVHPDGRAELLTAAPDLLLGLAPDTDRHDHTHCLPPGATVLLYTDGLVERRGEDLDTGLQRLLSTAARVGGLDLDALCDALLAELSGGAEDDVALLAIRAHPEDRPRPPEAGPEVLLADLVESRS